MASPSAPASANSKKAAGRGVESLTPPEERFWIRYSPHHELPFSMAGSFLLHALGVGLIALILIGALTLFAAPRPPEMSPVRILPAGGGGNPAGHGDGPNTGVVLPGKEALPKDDKPLVASQPKVQAPDLKEVPKNPEIKLDVPKETVTSRPIQDSSVEIELNRLSEVGKAARKQIDGIMAGHGKGGPGQGGGKGAGDGTGTGNQKGPGNEGRLNQRTKRQQRWHMNFITRDGNDYLRQLHSLGGIIAVPQPDGGFVLYRDLARRPFRAESVDLATINRISWINDKRESVLDLAQALGLVPPPPYMVIFLPESLEEELRRKEQQHYGGNEENIEETHFQVVSRGGKYVPIIVTKPRVRGQ